MSKNNKEIIYTYFINGREITSTDATEVFANIIRNYYADRTNPSCTIMKNTIKVVQYHETLDGYKKEIPQTAPEKHMKRLDLDLRYRINDLAAFLGVPYNGR